MKDIKTMVRQTKVIYEPFSNFVIQSPLSDFIQTFRYPFLVGQDLYEGNLKEKTVQGYNPTFRFQGTIDPEHAIHNLNAVNRSIFFLKPIYEKRMESTTFTIGRTDANDIIIVDYSISKEHASIIMKNNRYYVTDNGATNGVTINSKKIGKNSQHPLKPKDKIIFGRLGFIFMRPIDIFITFRQHADLEDTLLEELVNILKFVKKRQLNQLGASIGIDGSKHSTSSLIKAILLKRTPTQFLEGLF